MSEEIYTLLDELYFLTDYQTLQRELGWQEALLSKHLQDLVEKGWVECYGENDMPLSASERNLPAAAKNYRYLATKQGLMVHTKG